MIARAGRVSVGRGFGRGSGHGGSGRGRRGFALIAVLAALAIMGLIVGSLAMTLRVNRPVARDFADRAVVEARMAGMVAETVAHLLAPRIDDRWRVDGIPQTGMFDGERFEVAIQDAQGLIDLNTADGPLLRRLLTKVGGMSDGAAQSLSEAIEDWRERDPDRRHDPGAAQKYRDAGRPYHPRGGPFLSVDEVTLVLGMTPEIFTRINPALVLFTGLQTVDPATAPLECLLTIPEMSAAAAAALVGKRSLADGGAGPVGSIVNGKIDPSIMLEGRIFIIRVQHNGHEEGRVTIRITRKDKGIFWVLA